MQKRTGTRRGACQTRGIPLDVVVGRVLGDVVHKQGTDCVEQLQGHKSHVMRHTLRVTRYLRRGSTLK
jgi:hypothetical protein